MPILQAKKINEREISIQELHGKQKHRREIQRKNKLQLGE
ncbi:hypothetical protein SiRe_0870 [Sulfolobus islandicus REY15A]|uniref:Uncharacterized protein n=1 Tax=Saccharolobus islandicus (strain REY15A) TaxID=930945 RepID=F0NE08_SACI5|nr:hypothetical protein SiRe_0870 [Sulfolobus islandicus REY15A]